MGADLRHGGLMSISVAYQSPEPQVSTALREHNTENSDLSQKKKITETTQELFSHWPLFLAQPAGPARNVCTRLCWVRWAACSRSQGQNQLAIQNLLICSDHATAVQSINLEAAVLQEDARAGAKLTKMYLSFVEVPDPYWWGHLCLKL